VARGGDAAAARGGDPAAADAQQQGRGRGGRGAAGRGAAGGRGDVPAEFQPAPRIAVNWSKFRGPGDVKFDAVRPSIDEKDGKATTSATFGAPGEYVLRVEGNDSTGPGGGGFQCCWTNVHVGVTVKAPSVSR